MASTICNSFKTELLGGIHDLDTDTIKIALYNSSATLSADTTVYTTTNEVTGSTGYTAGGNTLSGAAISLYIATAIVDFSDTTWSNASITARYALIYNFSKANKAIAVLDFIANKTSTFGNFTIAFPSATNDSAIIRIS